MPTSESWIDFNEYLQSLPPIYLKDMEKKKIVIKKPETEELPKSFQGMYEKYKEMKENRDFWKEKADMYVTQVNEYRDKYERIYDELMGTFSVEHIREILLPYIKVNKLPLKLKTNDPLNEFITFLMHQGHPTEDELVD